MTTCLSTSIGCATAPSSGSATSRFSSARRAKRDHLVELSAEAAFGTAGRSASRMSAACSRPRISIGLAEQGNLERAALDQQRRDSTVACSATCCETIRFASVISDLDAVVDELRLERVVLVDQHLDGRLLGVERRQRARACRSGPRARSAPRARRRRGPSARPRRGTRTSTHSTRSQSRLFAASLSSSLARRA